MMDWKVFWNYLIKFKLEIITLGVMIVILFLLYSFSHIAMDLTGIILMLSIPTAIIRYIGHYTEEEQIFVYEVVEKMIQFVSNQEEMSEDVFKLRMLQLEVIWEHGKSVLSKDKMELFSRSIIQSSISILEHCCQLNQLLYFLINRYSSEAEDHFIAICKYHGLIGIKQVTEENIQNVIDIVLQKADQMLIDVASTIRVDKNKENGKNNQPWVDEFRKHYQNKIDGDFAGLKSYQFCANTLPVILYGVKRTSDELQLDVDELKGQQDFYMSHCDLCEKESHFDFKVYYKIESNYTRNEWTEDLKEKYGEKHDGYVFVSKDYEKEQELWRSWYSVSKWRLNFWAQNEHPHYLYFVIAGEKGSLIIKFEYNDFIQSLQTLDDDGSSRINLNYLVTEDKEGKAETTIEEAVTIIGKLPLLKYE